MKPYSQLCILAPEAYLKPEDFTTGFDTDALAKKQYEKGLKVSNESVEVGISANGCWYAVGHDGSLTTSYEGVGFHTNTADLLRGLLAGTAKFHVYRNYGSGTYIKK
jgi:hypothetical protein